MWHGERYTNGDANGETPPDHVIVQGIRYEPVTEQRKPYMSSKGSKLLHPGTARVNIAPSAESPHGTTANGWAEKHAHQTVLQQHCDFFDQDRDGVIWPSDTFIGFHRVGFGIFLSIIAAFIIHINFSYPTATGWLPDPFFRINLKNMHRTIHGGDTRTYDNEGRYIPQKFEEIFTKYADGRDYLTFTDMVNMLKGQRNVSDPIGWGGAIFEWGATYLMLWPADGRMMKEDIRAIFDGSIFYVIAERRAKGLKATPTTQ
ncbi:Caleosin-domain-containing protein [Setomelanomma holmii]|uniref:Caleosin-domain-containing protein n=1 Tax=Setomelanomma holmii TaxID=210430 RepID=A0A9P4H8L3_9PLEO|nr:Caleosin-domain-containing protein [Setomelanomma holmii]